MSMHGKTKQVMAQLIREIREGGYAPGAALPSRPELMARFDISRATVDKIIGKLVAEELLSSQRGSGTYVSHKGVVGPHIFVVLNNEQECEEAAQYHHQLGLMLAQISSQFSHTLMSSREFLNHVPAISGNAQARVIWSRPSLRCWTALHDLKAAAVPQIMINRVCPDFNYVATDTVSGVKQALRNAAQQWGDRVALVSVRAHPGEPFVQEREAAMLETCASAGLRPSFVLRAADRQTATLAAVADQARQAAATRKFDFAFVAEHALAPLVAGGGGGNRFPMVTVDWRGSPGQKVISLHQRWDEMFRTAVAWAAQARPQSLQLLIPPTLE